jgi:hypothetical protein
MQKVDAIFDAWPSLAEFARDVGVRYGTAAAWKYRGSIPGEQWMAIIRAAHRRGLSGITADQLVRLHARDSDIGDLRAFSEEGRTMSSPAPVPSSAEKQGGHFTRFKHLRRHHYKSAQEIEEYIRALRDEWSHR